MPLILALWLIGLGIIFSGGFFSVLGLFMVFCSLTLWTYVIWSWGRLPSRFYLQKYFNDNVKGTSRYEGLLRPFGVGLVVLVTLQLALVCFWLLGLTKNEYSMMVIVALAGVVAIVGVLWSLRSPYGWWLQLTTFCLLNIMLLIGVQNLRIDILVFQRDSAAALIDGRNPYTLTFPNISDKGDASHEYGPGMSINKRLQFGYVYLPLTLIGVLPGYLLGDFRFSYVVAVLLSAFCLFGLKPTGEKALLGALYLWSPATILILKGYTEYFVAAVMCLVLHCSMRQQRWLPLACGFFLASKQYAILCLPLFWLLVPAWTQQRFPDTQRFQSETALLPGQQWRGFTSLCAQSLAIAGAISLPMALWDWSAFYYSAIKLQFLQPFRADSLSFLALAKHWGMGQPPQWLPFIMFVGAVIIALKTLSSRPSHFFLSLAWVFLVFFSFSKQGMANYYYFVGVAMACTIMACIEEEQKSASLARGSQHKSPEYLPRGT